MGRVAAVRTRAAAVVVRARLVAVTTDRASVPVTLGAVPPRAASQANLSGSVVRDWLGVHPLYFREDGSAVAGSIAALLAAGAHRPLLPDREGLLGWLAGEPDDRRTCFSGIGLVPAGHRLVLGGGRAPSLEPPPPLPEPRGNLEDALVQAVAAIVEPPRRIALALSGGLDSALVLAIVRRVLGRSIPVVTLAIEIPGYGEIEATRAMARYLGVELRELPATAHDVLDALPEAVRAAEVPMFNAHPVSKLLLARALRREGFEAVITGDAADQAFSGAPRRNWLPLVGRLARSQGIEPCSPFFDLEVLAHATRLPVDRDKRALREVAARWLPRDVSEAPKAARLAPDLGAERLVGTDAMVSLAARLGLPPPQLDDERARCAHATLCLLWHALSPEP
jgi:asparagine synthase (glutamine-hydrolysing)